MKELNNLIKCTIVFSIYLSILISIIFLLPNTLTLKIVFCIGWVFFISFLLVYIPQVILAIKNRQDTIYKNLTSKQPIFYHYNRLSDTIERYQYLGQLPSNKRDSIIDSYGVYINLHTMLPVRLHKSELSTMLKQNLSDYESAQKYRIKCLKEKVIDLEQELNENN